jgi:hypothetical protein
MWATVEIELALYVACSKEDVSLSDYLALTLFGARWLLVNDPGLVVDLSGPSSPFASLLNLV